MMRCPACGADMDKCPICGGTLTYERWDFGEASWCVKGTDHVFTRKRDFDKGTHEIKEERTDNPLGHAA